MIEQDGFRIEAALQLGFEEAAVHCGKTEVYACTEAQLIAFAKACERKALCTARSHVRQELNNPLSARDKCPLLAIMGRLSKQIAQIDAELAPILEAERQRCLKFCPCGAGVELCPGPDGKPLCEESDT